MKNGNETSKEHYQITVTASREWATEFWGFTVLMAETSSGGIESPSLTAAADSREECIEIEYFETLSQKEMQTMVTLLMTTTHDVIGSFEVN